MWSEIAGIYSASKKTRDVNWFTEYIARPPAAVVVYLLRSTPITPNQVTFLSFIVAAIACAMLVLLPGWEWLVAAALVFEFSFVLDCADGQLARLRKTSSPLGHLLDFLMDELKAMLLLGCVTVRLWLETRTPVGDGQGDYLLVMGLAALFCLAAGLSLTSFTRRPEYGAKPNEDSPPTGMAPRRSVIGSMIALIEWAARVVVHYPQYLWLCALVNRIDIYFWAYAGVNALYLAKTLAAIMFRLGRFQRGAPGGTASTEPIP
ncbi:MAG: CDP-alcohol phosphatidyltransferase family protein [Kofleriaceae bacterium]